MKRIIAVLSVTAVAVALAGCSAVSGPSGLDPIDLSNADVIQSLDCKTSTEVTEFVSEAADAPPSGKRNALKKWGVDPNDEEFLAGLVATLEEHTATVCEGTPPATAVGFLDDNSEEHTDADATDAEKSSTLDSTLWDLDWKYPQEWLDLIKKFGFATETLDDGSIIPKFEKVCTAPGFKDETQYKDWSDAILPPLAHKSAEYVIALIMTCPDYGAHFASGLAQDETRILAGKSLFELNPQLEEFRDPAGINDWAQAVYDGTDADKLAAAKKLGLVALLLWNVDNKPSIEQRTAFLHYRMVVDGDGGQLTMQNPYKVREFEKVTNKPYKGEFLVFALSFKGQKGCWLEILVNTGDGRFALGKRGCDRPPTAPPPPKTGCKSDCDLASKDTDARKYQGPGKDDKKDAGTGDKEKAKDDGKDKKEPEVEKPPPPSDPPPPNEGGDN